MSGHHHEAGHHLARCKECDRFFDVRSGCPGDILGKTSAPSKEEGLSGPIERLSGGERITVPGHLLSPRGGDHYVLRVVGDSMAAEGILEGYFVIVLRRDAAEPGEAAVVLAGDEASIKRVYPDDGGGFACNRSTPPSRRSGCPPPASASRAWSSG